MTVRAKEADDDVAVEFRRLVNMTARQLEAWLATDESKAVGVKAARGREATGHASGRHIVKILGKRVSERTDSDRVEMHRVVGYIKRHLAQRPSGDVSETRWAYSLKNWGHDPTKH